MLSSWPFAVLLGVPVLLASSPVLAEGASGGERTKQGDGAQKPAFEEIPLQPDPPEVTPQRPLDEPQSNERDDQSPQAPPAPKQPPAGPAPPEPPPAPAPPPAAEQPSQPETMKSVTVSEPAAMVAPAKARVDSCAPACCTPKGAYLHDGLYLRLNLGTSYTSLRMTEIDVTARGFGPSFGFSVGKSVAERWVVAGGITTLSVGTPTVDEGQGGSERGDQNLSLAELGVFTDFYFAGADRGWHASAGLAFGLAQLVPDTFNSSSPPSGGGFVLGVGYDAWVGEQWSIGPLLRSSIGFVEDGDNVEFQDQTGRYFSLRLDVSFLHH